LQVQAGRFGNKKVRNDQGGYDSLPQGIITKGVGGLYTVKSGTEYFYCRARGVFRKEMLVPMPGDYVEFEIISEKDKQGFIKKIQDRKNQLARPAVSNIDQLALFIAVRSPEPDLFLVDKLIISALAKNIEPVLCINKCDLDDSDIAEKLYSIYNQAGIKTIKLCAINKTGIEQLLMLLPGKITAFAGQSGAGKSTTLNAIFGKEMMETGSVSRKTERGRHTTRHAELFEIDGGYIVDSPGFSNYDLEDMEMGFLKNYYPEFNKLEGQCKFRECIHVNEPCCAVKEAVDRGIMDSGRYKRYVAFTKILEEREANKYR